MEIVCLNTRAFKKLQGISDYNQEVLIIKLEKLAYKEKKFLEKNRFFFREKENKIEIIILSFQNYLVEYNSNFKNGIYFEETEEYHNFYQNEIKCSEEMDRDVKNLVICKNRIKIEVLSVLAEGVIKDDMRIIKKYFSKEEK